MVEVLICGSAAVDMIFHVEHFPDRPEKYTATGARIGGGGCAGNAAVAVARLGGTARLAARAGDDLVGDLMLAQLNRAGVDTDLVQRRRQGRSAFSSVYIDPQGERQIMAFRGADLPETLPEAALGDPAAVLADTRWQAGAETVLAHARRLGRPGVLDGEVPASETLMMLASHVAFSAQGLREAAATQDLADGLRRIAARTGAWVCVTDGPAGALYLDAEGLHHAPAARITPVDTLGAGDVWHGAFTLRLAEGAREADAVRFANAAASLKCLATGGAHAAPSWAEAAAFLEKTTP